MTAPQCSPDSERLRFLMGEHRADMQRIFAEYGARDVKLFGSVARGNAGSSSDIDLLVSIDAPDYEQVASMLGIGEALSRLLGVKVDVVARGVAKDAVSRSALTDTVDV